MRRLVFLVPLLVLSACGDGQRSPDERGAGEPEAASADAATQAQSAEALEPQKILYPDIERHELYGASCAFVPEGGGFGAIALAMVDGGYMKLDGEIVRFAPDEGSPEIPYGGRTEYGGTDYSFRLDVTEGEGRQTGMESVDYDGSLTVRNAQGQIVYRADGLTQCGA